MLEEFSKTPSDAIPHTLKISPNLPSNTPRNLPSRRDPFASLLSLVSRTYNVEEPMLFATTRKCAHIAHTRQVAMYLSHVALGLSLTETGRRFGRDRTTAAYACSQVEDRRDDSLFDLGLIILEETIACDTSNLEQSARC